MAVKILMPKGSDTMTEGKVLKWLKREGDAVSAGDAVVEIETDKVDMEVEAMGSGILRKILAAPGKVAPVGELLAVVGKAEEDISALLKGDGASAPAAAGKAAAGPGPRPSDESPHGRTAAQALGTPAPVLGGASAGQAASERGQLGGVSGTDVSAPSPAQHSATPAVSAAGPPPAPGRVFASPLARKMAKEMGLELGSISGSGPGGRIVREDVERNIALRQGAATELALSLPKGPELAPARAVAGPPHPPLPYPSALPIRATGPEYFDEPLSLMRRAIATRLVASKAPVPHFYLTLEVDMKQAKELRESASRLDPGLNLSYNDIILKASAAALRLHPGVNASFQGESIRFYRRIHLGMAVATDDGGLITPVIRNADSKGLAEISREAKELAGRARARKLLPEEYTGATFSVSNLGMFGIEEFSAVINPPEGAILAVGAVMEKAVAAGGRVEAGWRCRLTLSCDHRVVDGALGARFLQSLKQILENPVYLAL